MPSSTRSRVVNDEPPPSGPVKGFGHVAPGREQRFGLKGKGAGLAEMLDGMPDRLHGQDEHVEPVMHIAGDIGEMPARDIAIGGKRQVRAVRLDGGDGQYAHGPGRDERTELWRRQLFGKIGGQIAAPFINRDEGITHPPNVNNNGAWCRRD
jgi:hypothetical protein